MRINNYSTTCTWNPGLTVISSHTHIYTYTFMCVFVCVTIHVDSHTIKTAYPFAGTYKLLVANLGGTWSAAVYIHIPTQTHV